MARTVCITAAGAGWMCRDHTTNPPPDPSKPHDVRPLLLPFVLLLVPAPAAAGQPPAPAPMRAQRLTQPPVIDGTLDDEAWAGAPLPTGTVAVLQPAPRRPGPAADHGLGRLRRRRALFRVPLRRPGARPHQDVDHAPRQHLERRLGGTQPRCAGHRAGLVSPAGQSERHPARHDQHASPATKTRRPTGCGRAPARVTAERLHGRDPAAAADDPLQRRQRRADGHPVLAADQPAGRVGGLAGARAGQMGVREARAALVRRAAAASHARGDPVGAPTSRNQERRDPVVLARRRRPGRSGPQRQMGPDADGHARRDDQSRLQPGRERRLPGRDQPAISRLLLREAPVLHGGCRPVQPGRQRAGGRVDALRRAHPADRRPDLRRQADRFGRPPDVRQPDRRRSGARTHQRSRRPTGGAREALPGLAGTGQPGARQLRGGAEHGDAPRGTDQRHRRRRCQPRPARRQPDHRLRPRLEHHRRTR